MTPPRRGISDAVVELHPTSPAEYQRMFYEQVGLPPVRSAGAGTLWHRPGVGTIRAFGSLDEVQTGVGDYVIPCDFITHYQYDFAYLHCGMVLSGFTYAVDDAQGDEHPLPRLGTVPSTFVTVETAPVSAVRWTSGLRFKGTEISISMAYLTQRMLPVLGLEPDDLAYLRPNTRYTHLPEELVHILERAEALLVGGTYTQAMQRALALEFVACLARPDVERALTSGERMATERLRVGDRTVTVTGDEFRRIARVHAYLIEHACEFPSIKALAREVGVSEQKLKLGFYHMYQMTVWEFANTVRMDRATALLRETDARVCDVAVACGYQSQAAFIEMYRRWSGMTPSRFRARLRGEARTGNV